MPAALERTHHYAKDLDWLPKRWRGLRLLAPRLGGATMFVLSLICLHWRPPLATLLLLPALVAAASLTGNLVARGIVRRRVARLARKVESLPRLWQEQDGAIVRVRGRVRARKTVPTLLPDEASAVYRRVILREGKHRHVHESAEDFMLLDETGEQINVLVDGARLIAPDPKLVKLPPRAFELLAELPWFAFVRESLARAIGSRWRERWSGLRVGEVLLRDGDEVWVIGHKSRVVDPTVERLDRETPMRPTLGSGKGMPLLITPVTDEERRQLASSSTLRRLPEPIGS